MNSAITTSYVLGLPGLLAIAGYGVAALPGERFAGRLRMALLVGWLLHAVAIVFDIGGLGSESSGPRIDVTPY